MNTNRKIRIEYRKAQELKLLADNPREHSESDIQALRQSLREFGFVLPVLINEDGVILAHNGIFQAAVAEGIEDIPCVHAAWLSEDQAKAYVIADNRLAELSAWNMPLATAQLSDLKLSGFNFAVTGFDEIPSLNLDSPDDGADWFETREEYDNDDLENEDEEYQEFVEKFKPKRTSDDCYTPKPVYEALANYVAERYALRQENFVRPFYPGGDYKSFKYSPENVVVDNPPFSILSEIVDFYDQNRIKFFLFAQSTTIFSCSVARAATAIPVAVDITFENGAKIQCGFVTNLEDKCIAARSCPELFRILKHAAEEARKEITREIPKYSYPDEICTSSMLGKYSKYGIDFQVARAESEVIDALDAQKESGKSIYGKGLIISARAAAERAAAERAAAERAAAERWELSEREKAIVARLGKNGG